VSDVKPFDAIATTDASDGGAPIVCNTIVDTAPSIPGALVAEDPSGSEMFLLEAGVAQLVATNSDGGTSSATMQFTFDAGNMTWNVLCPTGAPADGGVTFPYGVDDAGSFTYYVDLADLGVVAATYTKQ